MITGKTLLNIQQYILEYIFVIKFIQLGRKNAFDNDCQQRHEFKDFFV